jgi:hypothetical protein
MTNPKSILACIALLCAAPVFPQNAPITAEDPALIEAKTRGKMLYDYDQAAWHSTDTFADMAGDLRNQKLVGRVVVPAEGGLQAIYYGKNDAGRYAIFSGLWNGSKITDAVFSKDDTGPALSAQANSYAEIVEMLISGKVDTKSLWFCNKQTPNFVILPGKASGEYALYMMTPQASTTSFPLGGDTI